MIQELSDALGLNAYFNNDDSSTFPTMSLDYNSSDASSTTAPKAYSVAATPTMAASLSLSSSSAAASYADYNQFFSASSSTPFPTTWQEDQVGNNVNEYLSAAVTSSSTTSSSTTTTTTTSKPTVNTTITTAATHQFGLPLSYNNYTRPNIMYEFLQAANAKGWNQPCQPQQKGEEKEEPVFEPKYAVNTPYNHASLVNKSYSSFSRESESSKLSDGNLLNNSAQSLSSPFYHWETYSPLAPPMKKEYTIEPIKFVHVTFNNQPGPLQCAAVPPSKYRVHFKDLTGDFLKPNSNINNPSNPANKCSHSYKKGNSPSIDMKPIIRPNLVRRESMEFNQQLHSAATSSNFVQYAPYEKLAACASPVSGNQIVSQPAVEEDNIKPYTAPSPGSSSPTSSMEHYEEESSAATAPQQQQLTPFVVQLRPERPGKSSWKDYREVKQNDNLLTNIGHKYRVRIFDTSTMQSANFEDFSMCILEAPAGSRLETCETPIEVPDSITIVSKTLKTGLVHRCSFTCKSYKRHENSSFDKFQIQLRHKASNVIAYRSQCFKVYARKNIHEEIQKCGKKRIKSD